MEPRKAIVVGASSGIGAAVVKELARRGWRVAALARREDLLRQVCDATSSDGRPAPAPYPHDVTRSEEVPGLFDRIVADLGGLDMVVYAAGVMPRIDDETYEFEKDRLVIEVNTLGCMAWLNCAARLFRAQGHGHVVGISSVAGDRGRRGYPAYNTSKAAMDTFLEALRNRLHRHGVRVTTIKPGFVDTAMTDDMEGLFWVIGPEAAARAIVGAAEKGRHTRYVPRRWALVGLVIRNIPSFIFRRMNI